MRAQSNGHCLSIEFADGTVRRPKAAFEARSAWWTEADWTDYPEPPRSSWTVGRTLRYLRRSSDTRLESSQRAISAASKRMNLPTRRKGPSSRPPSGGSGDATNRRVRCHDRANAPLGPGSQRGLSQRALRAEGAKFFAGCSRHNPGTGRPFGSKTSGSAPPPNSSPRLLAPIRSG